MPRDQSSNLSLLLHKQKQAPEVAFSSRSLPWVQLGVVSSWLAEELLGRTALLALNWIEASLRPC